MTSHLRGWVIYILLLFLRFLFVFDLQSGYLHPDEYFQGIEVAAGDIYNLDVLRTWEFQLDDKGPLRSVAGMSPFVHIPIQAAKWIHGGIDYKTEETDFNGSDMLNRILFPSRLVTVLGSYLVDLFILRCCIRVDHHQVSAKQTKIQKILHAVQYHSVPTALLLYASCAFGGSLWSTRTIVNVWESIYVSLFGLLFLEVLDRLEQSSDPTVNKQSLILFMCIQSAVVVWGTFLRPTYILFILPLGIIELAFILVKFKYISMILCLPSVLLVFFNTFICVIIDTLYFHNVSLLQAFQVDFSRFKLIYTPYRFLTYNSNSYHVSSHGLHSRFTHFLINWPLIFGPIFTFRLFTQPLQRRSISSCIAWISVVFPTFVLSTIPHQEARFLIPCLPCACFVVGQSVDAKVRHTKRKDVSCTCISILVLWIFHQFILILFYGYLHQAGLFSYMRTIPSNVTGCVTHVFFRTYMPPRFLLNIPLEKSSHYPSQSCKSLIDLGGSNVTILNNTINHLKTYQNFSGILKLAYPGSIQPLENLLLSSWGNVVMCEQFFPHLSMENPPSIRHPFVYENWKSQLSLHVLTIKV
ncbi:NAD-dependent protein deacetylase sirtuin-6, variant 3 [Schistosoma haematobium]|uniref:Mannosyltransferase n=1 Tax=Schistosoma haematobium TaxID=6185 RepID=A0A922IR82_SCHHA|nr:NAD-dependent protein deacetylase sirtuin-6, variant 3 [Schistosoma haematobium]KAH9585148.1 NAD-dependent protein deacetylase sirtuin-6, variant 3 [Schistosoma haematobium]